MSNHNNIQSSKIPITFQDFCNFYGVHHYGDKKTYTNINSIWKPIHKTIQKKQLLFPNFEQLINYLNTEYTNSQPEYKFMHWYIINEFHKYQVNFELYFKNLQNYNKRLIGYSKARNCHNMKELKLSLTEKIKRIKTDGTDNNLENKREFLIMARYICDYLEDFPEDMPIKLFNS